MLNCDNDLHKAANSGDLEICKILMGELDELGNKKYTANDSGAGGRTPFHRSAGGGHYDLMEFFLNNGANINLVDDSGRTPLHWASISGHDSTVKYLLSQGADVLILTKSQNNCLHSAVDSGKENVVRVIAEYVNNNNNNNELKVSLLSSRNSDGRTPLELATINDKKNIAAIIKALLNSQENSAACMIN